MAISEEQREAIRSQWDKGLDNQEISTLLGVSRGTIAAVKAHLTRGTYSGLVAAEAEAEVESAIDTKFGLERDLQLALRRNIEQLEPGLVIIDNDKERLVASGRIDITARDHNGCTVVIELKVDTADRDAVGQILGYMGDLMDQGEKVRGVLVAREFTPRARSAARAASNVQLVAYGFRFSFETISQPGPDPAPTSNA